MYVEAIYKNGVLVPLRPLKLKTKQARIQIIIPDSQVEFVSETSGKLREKIDAILGNYAHPRPAGLVEKDKAVWHTHLEEKYGA